MSADADMRDTLETIAEMLPLSHREMKLAEMVVFGYANGQLSLLEEVESDPDWWGEKAAKACKAVDC